MRIMVYRDWKMNEAFFGDDLSEIGNGGLRHRQLAPGKFPGNFLGGGSTHEDRVVGIGNRPTCCRGRPCVIRQPPQ